MRERAKAALRQANRLLDKAEIDNLTSASVEMVKRAAAVAREALISQVLLGDKGPDFARLLEYTEQLQIAMCHLERDLNQNSQRNMLAYLVMHSDEVAQIRHVCDMYQSDGLITDEFKGNLLKDLERSLYGKDH